MSASSTGGETRRESGQARASASAARGGPTPFGSAVRHLRHYRGRSTLLVLAVVLVCLLPIALRLVVADVTGALTARAEATPLVVGARGSRFDLALAALSFRGDVPRDVPLRAVDELRAEGLGEAVPLRLGHSARGHAIVGTSHDYYAFRGLRFLAGEAPVFLGEVVLGASVAQATGLGVGDTLLSDQGSLFGVSLDYPLELEIVGVLAATGQAEDDVVLCDLQTSWVLEGASHGHVDAGEEREERVLARDGERVVLSPETYVHTRIDATNRASFHLHEERDALPVTAIVSLPEDTRAATILRGRLRDHDELQLVVPKDVVDELSGFVFRIQRVFDAHAAVVAVALVLLFVLVVLLSLRLRRAEFATLRALGLSRGLLVRLVVWEWLVLLGIAALLTATLGWGLAQVLAAYGERLVLGGGA